MSAYLAAFKEYVPSRFGRNISDNDVLRKSQRVVQSIAMTASVMQFPCTVSSQSSFEYIKLLGGLAAEENNGIPLPAYQVIMNAVRYSLQEELPFGHQVLFSSRYGEIAVKNPDGTVMDFMALSDGYWNVIKIVTDIATKMCILNPYLGGNALQMTPGVVVIDELDLSLHPTWQRRIVRILKELFPKIQFICATHSPFIIQSLEPGELVALDTALDEEYSGQSIEDIAEDIMMVPKFISACES